MTIFCRDICGRVTKICIKKTNKKPVALNPVITATLENQFNLFEV